jgi:hypothetical protein
VRIGGAADAEQLGGAESSACLADRRPQCAVRVDPRHNRGVGLVHRRVSRGARADDPEIGGRTPNPSVRTRRRTEKRDRQHDTKQGSPPHRRPPSILS